MGTLRVRRASGISLVETTIARDVLQMEPGWNRSNREDYRNKEVDFVICSGNTISAVEVKSSRMRRPAGLQ